MTYFPPRTPTWARGVAAAAWPAKPTPGAKFIDLINALGSIEEDGGGFDAAISLAKHRRASKSRVFFIGNGGSAAIASHMAADWAKTGQFRSQCFTDGALVTCLGNDLGYDRTCAAPIGIFADRADLLIAISSSGASPNILAGAAEARKIGMSVITLSGFLPTNPLRQEGTVNFYVPSMKYGTVEITHLAICHRILDQVMEGA